MEPFSAQCLFFQSAMLLVMSAVTPVFLERWIVFGGAEAMQWYVWWQQHWQQVVRVVTENENSKSLPLPLICLVFLWFSLTPSIFLECLCNCPLRRRWGTLIQWANISMTHWLGVSSSSGSQSFIWHSLPQSWIFRLFLCVCLPVSPKQRRADVFTVLGWNNSYWELFFIPEEEEANLLHLSPSPSPHVVLFLYNNTLYSILVHSKTSFITSKM